MKQDEMFSKQFICASEQYSTFEAPVPAPYFRRTLRLRAGLQSARLSVCGLGFYELFVNGAKITKGRLAPYISNPDDLIYYDCYDLKAHLRAGGNVLGFLLGNGMLNAAGGRIWDFDSVPWRSAPKLAVQLELMYEDGGCEIITADEAFRTAPSPIRMDDLRAGEWYDARKEIPGWNLPEYDDSGWTPAMRCKAPMGQPVLCGAQPVTVSRTIRPLSVRRGCISQFPQEHELLEPMPVPQDEAETEGWLYDFGVNTTGVCRLKIKGKPGQKVILQFGELLDETGGLDLRGMTFLPRRFNHRVIYICRGEGTEEYTPSFTYFGFRYCLVTGITEEQAADDLLICEEMHSELETRGSFRCSDPVINAIWEAAKRSDLSNFFYFPTDCPHREKNGWTGDAALSAEQMLCMLGAEDSFAEWLRNIRKAQRTDGALPGIVPTGGWGFEWGNGPAWDAVLFSLPYYTYLYRGNRQILAENAQAMMRYLRYLAGRRNPAGTLAFGLGDWCHAGREAGDPAAPLEVTDTVTGISICGMAEYCFGVLGKTEEEAFARTLREELLCAARENLLEPDGITVKGRCQTSQAMGLFYGLFRKEEEQAAFAVLRRLIAEKDDCMDVGVLGGRVLFHVLSRFGQAELACRMITQDKFPSYGLWIRQGATTLWEMFQREGEVPASKNHHFWGDVASWFIKNAAGILVNPYRRDASEILLHPVLLRTLTQAEGTYRTVSGTVSSAWQRLPDGTAKWQVQAADGVKGTMQAPEGYVFGTGKTEMPLQSGEYALLPDCGTE